MATIDHQLVIDLCRRKGWNIRRLRVNGEKFAYYANEVLSRLVQKGIIALWEKKQCQSGISLRNIMSHLTRDSILPPHGNNPVNCAEIGVSAGINAES